MKIDAEKLILRLEDEIGARKDEVGYEKGLDEKYYPECFQCEIDTYESAIAMIKGRIKCEKEQEEKKNQQEG